MSIFSFPNPTIAQTLAFILTDGTTVSQGDLLCGDPATGFLVAATAATATTVPVGFACFDYVGDGVHNVEVELFRPHHIYTFLNDASAGVAHAFAHAYIKDGSTVTATATGCPLGFAVWRSAAQCKVAVGAAFSFSS